MRHYRSFISALLLLLAGCGTATTPSATAPAPTPLPTTNRPTPLPTAIARAVSTFTTTRPTTVVIPIAISQSADISQVAAPQPTSATTNNSELLKIPDNDPRAIGDLHAPITIVEFSDFECPYCGRYEQDTAPLLLQRYIEKGVVRLVYRDFPIPSLHRSAVVAAVASRCAAAQQQFWPMHDLLFHTHLDEWGGIPKRDRLTMSDFAGRLKLDPIAFDQCMDDPQTAQTVLTETDQAGLLGVRGTPTFFINGQLVSGAIPIDSFDRIIAITLQQPTK